MKTANPMTRTFTRHFFLLLALCVAAGMAHALSPAGKHEDGSGTGRYIVLLEDPPVGAWQGGLTRTGLRLKATSPSATGDTRLESGNTAVKAYRGYLSERRADVLNRMESRLKRALSTDRVYEFALNGMVLEMSAAEAERLAGVPGVQSVVPEFHRRLETDAGPEWVNAPAVWSGAASNGVAGTKGEGVVIGIIDSGINPGHPSFADVGDDGHDHDNPRNRFFGSCASGGGGCNDKLIGIHDFTDEGSNGRDTDGHGSHVASTAAGNQVNARLKGNTLVLNVPISGVAPHANIISYKACVADDEEGNASCPGSALLDAIDQAVEDGVDVVNYSIGSLVNRDSPWQHPESRAMRNARASGIVVVSSAGNGGPGESTVTLPSVSPWVIAVANATHDRRFVNRLTDMEGGNAPAPMTMTGVGFTDGYGPAPIIHAGEEGNELCGEGPMDFPPTGASNPFPDGTFDGEIVVCDRGTYARVEKGFNVNEAGAGGYVLANTPEFGESVVSDDHYLPGVHIGLSDASVLRQWLSSGGERRARITGAERSLNPGFADIIAASSSRGPGPLTPHVMKPDLTAPGTSVLAAHMAEGGSTNRFQFLSGTSMSSPHVAGAAALLKATRPAWSAAEIHSALVSTARPEAVTDAVGKEAGANTRGSGRLDVAAAANAGLLLDESVNDFNAANPDTGGRPQDLNLPGLANHECFIQCVWERRFSAATGGVKWQAELDAPDGVQIQVEPAEFSMSARGDTRTVTVRANVRNAAVGEWINGSVRFVPVSGGASPSDFVMPLNVFVSGGDVPERLTFNVDERGGSQIVPLDDLVDLPDLFLESTGLARGLDENLSLRQDQTRGDPYDNFNDGTTYFKTVTVSENDRILVAEIVSSNATDIDLFVGRDGGDGEPELREELCASTSPDEIERCELTDPLPGEYWILVQNWAAAGNVNSVRMVSAVVPESGDDLVATGPATVDTRQAFDLRVSWDQNAMDEESRWYGAIGMGTEPGKPENLGLIPVLFKRSSQPGLAQSALVPDRPERFRLPGGTGHPGLYVDLPPDVERVIVRASTEQTADLDLFAAHERVPEGEDPDALQQDADVTGRDRVGGTTLVIDNAAGLEPGRWFVVPFNDSVINLEFTLSVEVELAGEDLGPRRGMWFNPDRSGHGIDLNRSGGRMYGLWFTYLEDGTPAWYLAEAPFEGNIWTADLNRYTWNGESARLTRVGTITVTFEAKDRAVMSWRLFGRSGSEPIVPCEGEDTCIPGGLATPVDRTGTWYAPAEPGWGDTVMTKGDILLHIFYLYDALGNPRWVLGDSRTRDVEGATTELLAFEGFCPTCDYVVPTTVPAGSVTTSFGNRTQGTFDVDIELPPAYPGAWNREGAPVRMLSTPVPE